MSTTASLAGGRRYSVAETTLAPAEPGHAAAVGFLAMLPLLAVYELARVSGGGASRNLAEVVVSLPLVPFGAHADLARVLVLGAAAIACGVVCFHAELGLGPRVFRIALEGLGAAVVFGPLLLVLLHLFGGLDALRGLQPTSAAQAPGLARAALLAGGAAYEELVFRMGLQGLLFLALRPTLAFWLGAGGGARVAAEVLAVLLASCAFAAAHLAVFTQVLGPGGEPYHAGIFPWRVLAGILLAALFRWRGPGVAAWTHASFNFATSIGAGPEVFL